MRVTNLRDPDGTIYSSNAYLIRGDWNRIEDVNTLVDVGRDPVTMGKIRSIATGVGKRAVEQVILTHAHFDHIGLLPAIRAAFHPEVRAWSSRVAPDLTLKDGDLLRCGDRTFEVIYTPGHSQDSICLYCEEEGVLFVGDTPVVIRSDQGTYEPGFIRALERLCAKKVETIYFGHREPVIAGGHELICASLRNVVKASVSKTCARQKARAL